MADATITVTCPQCREPLTIPLTLHTRHLIVDGDGRSYVTATISAGAVDHACPGPPDVHQA